MSASKDAPPAKLPRAQEVLDFWFGPGDPLSPPHFAERLHLWFGGDDPPEVIAERDATGTTVGAALLALGDEASTGHSEAQTIAALDIDLSDYASAWLERAGP